MSDDVRLPVGAAAPKVERVIGSLVTLDAIWVVVSATLLLAASRFEIIDLPTQTLATGDDGYRIYAVVLPVLALGIAVAGGVRQAPGVVAVATGLLAPSAAGVGVLSASIFLDRNAAFADVGVAASLGAASVCLASLVRWFVYHPASLVRAESRPTMLVSRVLFGVAVAAGSAIGFYAIDDRGDTTAQFVVQLIVALVVPFAAIAAAVVRTRLAFVVAGSAALSQFVAVLAVRSDASDDERSIELASSIAIWSGPVALIALALITMSVTASSRLHSVDDEPNATVTDDEPWRWSTDDPPTSSD